MMSETAAWKAWEGRIIEGRFTLRQWLGGSDRSAVFLTGLPGQASQKAAIKLIAAEGAEADRQVARWRAASRLSHPHLIRIFECGRCELSGSPLAYVVMELADEDLQQIIPQRALTPSEVSDLLPPLLDALSYLHDKGLVHGRIKLSNVLAVGDQVKLSADRVATPAEAGSQPTRRDVYDAPETAAGIVSPAGDLWSVGVTVVAALTQSVPFSGEAAAGEPGLPNTIAEPFRGIARECLHLDPKRRCSIADVEARLQPAARSVAAEPEPAPTAQHPGNRGRVVGAVLAVALLVGLVTFFSRGKSGRNGAPAPQTQTAATPQPQKASIQQPPPTAPVQQPAHQTVPAPSQQTPAQPKPTPTIAAKVSQPVATAAAPSKMTEAQPTKTSAEGTVVRRVVPDVPLSARNTITGKVRVSVRVQVDRAGKVTAAKLASAGPSKYFANLALKAAQGWEFSPEENGKPADWLLHFRFGRAGAEVSPEKVPPERVSR